MVRYKTSTCLATLHNGVMISSPDQEDTEQITLKEEICEPDSDDDDTLDDDDFYNYDDENLFWHFLASSHCTICIYVGLCLILIGTIVALAIISVQIVIPFQNVQHFLNGTCIPTAVVVKERNTCMCGIGCLAKYSCISIKVTYQDRNKLWRNATVYENESTLRKQVISM